MFKFKVTPDDGEPYEVVATSRDIARWERTNKKTGASLAGLQRDMRMGDLYGVAYNAAVRQGLYDGTAKEFEEGADLDILDADEPDPTRSAA